MTRNNQANDRKNGDNRTNGSTRNPQATIQTKVILKLKQVKPNDQQVKALFKNDDGTKTKETVSIFRDGDAKELLIELEKQLIRLGNRYDLFKDGGWRVLAQLGGRALGGRIERYWSDIVEGVTINCWNRAIE